MNTSDYINLFVILVWCAVLFGQGVLVGLALASDKARDEKHDSDDDTTPPTTITE